MQHVQFLKACSLLADVSVNRKADSICIPPAFHKAVNRCLHYKWHYSEVKVTGIWLDVLLPVLSR